MSVAPFTVTVVVPAANEQDTIAECLQSVRAARRSLLRETGATSHAVVVLDACDDGTAAVVRDFPDVTALSIAERRVGTARRLGCEHALARYPATTWLASTDADSIVPANWLIDMAERAGAGAELVLGTVQPGTWPSSGVEKSWRAAHTTRDGHGHVHGANLGIDAGAYGLVGGWRDLAVHEDVDLVTRAAALDLPFVRSGQAPVLTSARLTGRTPAGFASYLRALLADVATTANNGSPA